MNQTKIVEKNVATLIVETVTNIPHWPLLQCWSYKYNSRKLSASAKQANLVGFKTSKLLAHFQL